MERILVKDEDVFVEIIDLGNTEVPEVVHKNDDGTYTIFLNARFSFDRLQQSCRHAIFHIEHGDFDPGDIQTIEADAHKMPDIPAEEVQQRLHQEIIEKRRLRHERKRKKYKKKLAEYQAFADRMQNESPDLYAAHQEDLIYRY